MPSNAQACEDTARDVSKLLDIPERQPPPNLVLVGPDGRPTEALTRQAAVEKLEAMPGSQHTDKLAEYVARGAAFHHGGVLWAEELVQGDILVRLAKRWPKSRFWLSPATRSACTSVCVRIFADMGKQAAHYVTLRLNSVNSLLAAIGLHCLHSGMPSLQLVQACRRGRNQTSGAWWRKRSSTVPSLC